jgi:arylsulfatase A-like enzyme
MFTFQDVQWAHKMISVMDSHEAINKKSKDAQKNEPNFQNRCAIRSVFDGRYRFSRYFGQIDFNRPTTWEELISKNDIELYDLESDPEEIVNLADDKKNNGDLVMAMNAKLNTRIDEEVGVDDGSFLPIRNGRWYFPNPKDR